jgi:hypothetical protein
MFSEPSVIASEPTLLNDLPYEILPKIQSHFGPEDLRLHIATVCKKWNVLAKDKKLWKTVSYSCDSSSDISCVTEVRCTKLFGVRANSLTNLPRLKF